MSPEMSKPEQENEFLREQNELLLQRLAEEHQMASIGRLLAGIVHEINTPIGSIFSDNEVFRRSVDMMRELLAVLIDDTSRQIGMLGDAIRARNAGETVRLAHYSKGACANVGARSTALILQQIERTAAQGDFERCGASLDSLAAELMKLRNEASRL